METMRHQTIVDYVDKLQAGLSDLNNRSLDVKAAYEAELAQINAEIERYKVLIADANKKAAEEARFVAEMETHRISLSAEGLVPSASGERLHRAKGDGRKPLRGLSKTRALQIDAERIVREESGPIKRSELTRRLQLLGHLVSSDNPVDLVRKALNNHEVVNFDVKSGYFISK